LQGRKERKVKFMRRILLIAALLLPISSAMATTTITAVDEGHFDIDGVQHAKIRIDYTSDVNVRAFALDLAVDNGTNIGDNNPTDFLAGESVAPSKGYGIFPSRFRDFIDPANPDWGDGNYMPATAWDEPGAENTGLGWPSMVVELGTLYSGDANRPDLTGTLFKFDVNSEGAADCNLTITADDLRGGLVDEDAAEITATNLPASLYIEFAAPECVKSTASFYNWWKGGDDVQTIYPTIYSSLGAAPWSSPDCYCYPRHCRGDADGLPVNPGTRIWVSLADLSLLRSSVNKLYNSGTFPANGICADFTHSPVAPTAGIPVSLADLSLLRSHINKYNATPNATVKCCDADQDCVLDGSDDFNFWTASTTTP
jgi:hypothetical protein